MQRRREPISKKLAMLERHADGSTFRIYSGDRCNLRRFKRGWLDADDIA